MVNYHQPYERNLSGKIKDHAEIRVMSANVVELDVHPTDYMLQILVS